jgi:hypothetical protein
VVGSSHSHLILCLLLLLLHLEHINLLLACALQSCKLNAKQPGSRIGKVQRGIHSGQCQASCKALLAVLLLLWVVQLATAAVCGSREVAGHACGRMAALQDIHELQGLLT